MNGQNVTQWNGLVGLLVNGEVECAIGALTMTAARAQVVDFSNLAFDVWELTVIMRVTQALDHHSYRFELMLLPFGPHVWYMLTSCLCSSTVCC